MNEQMGQSGLKDETPAILSALLDNNLEFVSKGVAASWQNSTGDHRTVVLTALCLLSAKNFEGLKTFLDNLDPVLQNHFVLSSLRDLVSQGGVLDKQNAILQQFTQFLDRARNLDLTEEQLGYKRSECPILTELNGDPFWIFADLLPYLWHVVETPIKSCTPRILAETEHYKWVSERLSPGDVVYDVGANMGLFTNMMSKRVGPQGKVRSFEPNPPAFEDLRRIVVLNQLDNVDLYPVAASDSQGVAVFNQILSGNVNREASGLVLESEANQSPQSAITVTTTTLDLIVASTPKPPSLIKIDVEGAEFQVIRGLRQTLAAFRPKLVIEFHADSNGVFDHSAMKGMLAPYNYKIEVLGKNYFCE